MLAAVLLMLGSVCVALIRSGRHEGRLEAILDRLVEVTADHEKRLRTMEISRRR